MELKNKLVRIYVYLVNLNQWFTYGKNWLLLPFSVLTIASSVSILLIFLGMERNIFLLGLVTAGILFCCLIFGCVLFVSKAEMIDKIMLQWRSPLTQLAEISFEWAILLYADKIGIPVPPELKEWGVTCWNDLSVIYRYALDKGKKAHALPICKAFFKRKDTEAIK